MRCDHRRRHLAVGERRDRRQAAGVDADADRDAALLRFLDDRLHLVDVADVAGVEAQAVEAGADRGQGPAVVEVDVGDQRHRRLADDLGQRVRGFLVRHGDADDLAAGSASSWIWRTVVSTSAVSVLVIDWTTTGASPPIFTSPTRSSPSRAILLGHERWLVGTSVMRRTSCCTTLVLLSALSEQRVAADDAGNVKVAEHDDEDQHRRHADEVDHRFLRRGDATAAASTSMTTKAMRPPSSMGSGRMLRIARLMLSSAARSMRLFQPPPRRPRRSPGRCRWGRRRGR